MNTNTTLKITLGTILIGGIIAVGLSLNHSKVNITKAEDSYLTSLQKLDSLTRVVDSLKIEIVSLEDGFDYKEHRYEDIIFQYELGLSYLKDYHSESYRAFHRFLAHKERYSKQDERENKKTLSIKEL